MAVNVSQAAYPVANPPSVGGQSSVISVVVGSIDANGNFLAASASAGLPVAGGGGGGGGGAITAAAGSYSAGALVDGADVTQGLTTDAVIAAGAAGTQSAKLRAISRDTGTVATTNTTIAAAPIIATAVVKAASTPAVSADPALVVSISPNNGVELLDSAGTTKATIKAASTAAAATDTSLVTQILLGGLPPAVQAPSGATTAALGSYSIVPAISSDLFAQNFAAISGTSATITPTSGMSAVFAVNATYTPGSSTGMDLVLQVSPDSSTSWKDVWHFERITANSNLYTPPLPISSLPRRVTWVNNTAVATTATVTLSSTRVSAYAAPTYQFFDHTAAVLAGTPVSSATSAYNVGGCKNVTASISILTVTTTSASYQMQTSADATNWANVGTATTATAAGTTVDITIVNNTKRYVRVIVSTAASGAQTASSVAFTAN